MVPWNVYQLRPRLCLGSSAHKQLNKYLTRAEKLVCGGRESMRGLAESSGSTQSPNVVNKSAPQADSSAKLINQSGE